MTAVFVEEGLDKGAIWHFGEVAKEQRALAEGKAWADLSHRSVIAIWRRSFDVAPFSDHPTSRETRTRYVERSVDLGSPRSCRTTILFG